MRLKIDRAWHSLTVEQVFEVLDSNLSRGLSAGAAAERLATLGPNELPSPDRKSWPLLLLSQFEDVMIWVLIAAALVSGILLREVTDAIAIAAILFINALLGFRQEYKAERAMEALRALSAPTATVIRDGLEHVIATAELVPGDLVVIEAGDKLPADMRVIEVSAMSVDESSLTGESHTVHKEVPALQGDDLPLAERTNLLYMGTAVTAGRGRAVVVATATATEFGKVAEMMRQPDVPTPLQEELDSVGKTIGVLVLAISAVVFVLGLVVRGSPAAAMFLIAVSLAVAAIPEGLPAVVTVSLSLGVQNMARANAIIRKLHAVETLGSTSVICTDKTGTLTENRMTVDRVLTRSTDFAPEELASGDVAGKEALIGMLLCNDARYGADEVLGDPTEVALLEAAGRAGLDWQGIRDSYPRIAEAPFDPSIKSMSTAHRKEGQVRVFVKGAPEAVLRRCSHYRGDGGVLPLQQSDIDYLYQQAEAAAAKGFRALAVAERVSESPDDDLANLVGLDGLTFLGIMALHDPPRAEAAEAVGLCKKAGIRVIMITGDHPLTAAAIADRVGLQTSRVVTGAELSAIDDDDIRQVVREVSVFARTDPADKQRLVRALQSHGYVVAMTGDGVNDAPALKKADIGISMGIIGTDVSKEAADMVLADDNFATIVKAVREGRHIFDNLSKFILFLLSCNVSEVLVLLVVTMLPWLPIPLQPVQLLWINLITDGLPAMALGVDPVAPGVMDRKPRPKTQGVLTRGVRYWTLWQGLVIAASVLTVFFLAYGLMGTRGARLQTIVFTTMVLSQLLHTLHFREPGSSVFAKASLGNRPLLLAVVGSFVLQLATLYIAPLQGIFGTAALDGWGWLMVVAGSVAPLLILDASLPLRRRFLSWEQA